MASPTHAPADLAAVPIPASPAPAPTAMVGMLTTPAESGPNTHDVSGAEQPKADAVSAEQAPKKRPWHHDAASLAIISHAIRGADDYDAQLYWPAQPITAMRWLEDLAASASREAAQFADAQLKLRVKALKLVSDRQPHLAAEMYRKAEIAAAARAIRVRRANDLWNAHDSLVAVLLGKRRHARNRPPLTDAGVWLDAQDPDSRRYHTIDEVLSGEFRAHTRLLAAEAARALPTSTAD